MIASCTLIFPNQLFEGHPALAPSRPIFLVEDSLFFGDPHVPCEFHLQKRAYHRITLRHYQGELEKKGYSVKRITHVAGQTIMTGMESLFLRGFREFHFCDLHDYLLERRLARAAKKHGLIFRTYSSPLFLTSASEADTFFENEKGYLMARFYLFQRKRLRLLIDSTGKPEGGKWSYDEENRKKLPSSIQIPPFHRRTLTFEEQKIQSETKIEFPESVGKASLFRPPVTRAEALYDFDLFLKERFENFGFYEDAISSTHSVIFHSVLTPALNIGLITPRDVIQRTIAFAADQKIPLNSVEGFIRQIVGWREFICHLYRREGVLMRKQNFFKHERPLPRSFYEGTTGIPLIDRTIHRLHENAYCHHIERLMILGNFMLLCGFEPHSVYQWFMEFFIDAYDWVMVPNVYGMSQFSDGGIFATKPYISSSNYILKMSDERKGSWQKVWDGLFWRFIHLHRDFFESNFRLSMMVRQLDKMPPEKFRDHLRYVENFFENDCIHNETEEKPLID